MALDRPDDDLTRPERQVPGGEVPAARSDPVEWRSHEEYYEALRAADGKPPEVDDSQADRSGRDSVDAADRPPADDIGVSPERTTHILDGEPGPSMMTPPLSSSSSPCLTVPSLRLSRTRSVTAKVLISQSIAAPASAYRGRG
jgi:hypothetical protein